MNFELLISFVSSVLSVVKKIYEHESHERDESHADGGTNVPWRDTKRNYTKIIANESALLIMNYEF